MNYEMIRRSAALVSSVFIGLFLTNCKPAQQQVEPTFSEDQSTLGAAPGQAFAPQAGEAAVGFGLQQCTRADGQCPMRAGNDSSPATEKVSEAPPTSSKPLTEYPGYNTNNNWATVKGGEQRFFVPEGQTKEQGIWQTRATKNGPIANWSGTKQTSGYSWRPDRVFRSTGEQGTTVFNDDAAKNWDNKNQRWTNWGALHSGLQKGLTSNDPLTGGFRRTFYDKERKLYVSRANNSQYGGNYFAATNGRFNTTEQKFADQSGIKSPLLFERRGNEFINPSFYHVSNGRVVNFQNALGDNQAPTGYQPWLQGTDSWANIFGKLITGGN